MRRTSASEIASLKTAGQAGSLRAGKKDLPAGQRAKQTGKDGTRHRVLAWIESADTSLARWSLIIHAARYLRSVIIRSVAAAAAQQY